MKSAYRILAYVIAIGVAVQAAVIAFAFFGLSNWIGNGGVLDKAAIEGGGANFAGSIGFMLHAMIGQYLLPLLALALVVVAFLAKIAGGVKWALITLGLVIVQVLFGLIANGLPAVGLLHGANALAVAVVAVVAGHRVAAAGHVVAAESVPLAPHPPPIAGSTT